MTSELQLKLLELLQPVLTQDKAREVVLTIERTIEEKVSGNLTLSTKEDIKELSRKIEEEFRRVNDRIEKLIYFVIGQFIALVGIMFAIAKFIQH